MNPMNPIESKENEMAELLILQFDGVNQADYLSVNTQLGLDPDTGKGDWPAGLITHLAGLGDDGHAFVVESWTSRQAQEEFGQNRLGAAMAQAGFTAVPTVTWATLIGEHHPGG